MKQMRITYSNLVGRQERRRPLATPGRIFEDNIKMDITEIGY
jgi:hypothetical protein